MDKGRGKRQKKKKKDHEQNHPKKNLIPKSQRKKGKLRDLR